MRWKSKHWKRENEIVSSPLSKRNPNCPPRVHLNFSFCLPHFLGAQKSEGFCSQSEGLHSGRDPIESKGGTGKAEAAKLPGAGISPKPCPRKCLAEKSYVPDSVESGGEDP